MSAPLRDDDELRIRFRRSLDWDIGWRVLIVAVILIGTLIGTWKCIWVGIGMSCIFAILAGGYYLNSARYVRDTWASEQKRNMLNKEEDFEYSLLSRVIRIQRDYQEVDRNLGIAFLAASVITLGITTIISIGV